MINRQDQGDQAAWSCLFVAPIAVRHGSPSWWLPLLAAAATTGDGTGCAVRPNAPIGGGYTGGEIQSRDLLCQPGRRTKVEWVAKPAVGNYVVSLFSLFNSEGLFFGDTPKRERPPWTEITFEMFGGAAHCQDWRQFQTQYISRPDTHSLSNTERGITHEENYFQDDPHRIDIYDGQFHKFVIEFLPVAEKIDAEISFRLDGKLLRSVVGGDANFLQPSLNLHLGVWVADDQLNTGVSNWACTPPVPPESHHHPSGLCRDHRQQHQSI